MTGPLDPLNQMRAEMGELDPDSPARVPDRHQQTGRVRVARNRQPPMWHYVAWPLALVVIGASVWGIVSSARVGNPDGGGQDVSGNDRGDVDTPPLEQGNDGAESFNPVAPPEPLGDISGTWEGPAEGDQDWYDVHLSIARSDGEWLIQIDYPQLDCGGILIPDEATSDGNVLVLIEQLTYGYDQCIDNGTVHLWPTSSDELYWEWLDGGHHIWAFLSRTGAVDADSAAARTNPGPTTMAGELVATVVNESGVSRYDDHYHATVTEAKVVDTYSIAVSFDAKGTAIRDPETSCLHNDDTGSIAWAVNSTLNTDEPDRYVGTLVFPVLEDGIWSFQYSCSDYSTVPVAEVTAATVGISRYDHEYYAVVVGYHHQDFQLDVEFAAHGRRDLEHPDPSCITDGSTVTEPTAASITTEEPGYYVGTLTFSIDQPVDAYAFRYACWDAYSLVPLQ